MRYLRMFSYQMILSHITVVLITAAVLAMLVVGLIQWSIDLETYRVRAMLDVTTWQFDNPQLLNMFSFNAEGFSTVVDEQNVVLYTSGDTNCEVGVNLAVCAPALVNLPEGLEVYQHKDEAWVQTVMIAKTGQRVISQRGPYESAINFGAFTIVGIVPILAIQAGIAAVISLPLALVFSFLVVRPQVRRIAHIAAVSREFANGDFDVRVRDSLDDEVGQLGQQFDDMAGTIQKNFQTLRDLAEQNASLARQVEDIATRNERLRLSRDLHDTIAQRLFSLSVTAATVPDAISEDADLGKARARTVLDMAESTLADLRALLVDLRPVDVIELGLSKAISTLIDQWQKAHLITIEQSIILTRDGIPTIVQDTVYRVTQEALNNIAHHANASSVTLTLVAGQRQLALGISDDGVGFDPDTLDDASQFGLRGMRERAIAVGGTLAVESTGAGTTILLEIPLALEYAPS